MFSLFFRRELEGFSCPESKGNGGENWVSAVRYMCFGKVKCDSYRILFNTKIPEDSKLWQNCEARPKCDFIRIRFNLLLRKRKCCYE